MATLTETAYVARRGIVVVAIGFVVIILGRAAFLSFQRWWTTTHPAPPPPPTVAFGVLPNPAFSSDRSREGWTFRLETIAGELPDLGSQAKVYFMPSFRANVLGLELATGLASRLGFLLPPVPDPSATQDQRYVWQRSGVLPGTLSIDLVTGYFTFMTSWRTDVEVARSRAPSAQEAEKAARDYLRRAGQSTDDLDKGKARVEFLQVSTEGLLPALSQSDAQLARVHLFRADIEKTPVVTPTGTDGLIQILVSGGRSEKQVVETQFRYSPVELERFATYPLRSTAVAWGEFQQGNGVIVKSEEGVNAVVVRAMELGYYDADTPQEFLQPVYVFRGDNNFVAYVSAIDSKWLKKE